MCHTCHKFVTLQIERVRKGNTLALGSASSLQVVDAAARLAHTTAPLLLRTLPPLLALLGVAAVTAAVAAVCGRK